MWIWWLLFLECNLIQLWDSSLANSYVGLKTMLLELMPKLLIALRCGEISAKALMIQLVLNIYLFILGFEIIVIISWKASLNNVNYYYHYLYFIHFSAYQINLANKNGINSCICVVWLKILSIPTSSIAEKRVSIDNFSRIWLNNVLESKKK